MKEFESFDNIQITQEEFAKYTKFLHDVHNRDFHIKRAEILGLAPQNAKVLPGALVNRETVKVGQNVIFAYYCYVNGDVTLEDNVIIGPHCAVTAGNHKFDPATQAFTARDNKDKDVSIVIGAGSWLAHSVTVTGGTKIGKANLICAGAVVTKSTPDYAIMAGIPAKQVGQIDPKTGKYLWYSQMDREDDTYVAAASENTSK